MLPDTVRIERRFAGPPNSGNGGYSCGVIAARIDGPACVTLRSPPPLDTDLDLAAAADGSIELRHGATLVGSGKACELELAPFEPPSFEEATAAAGRTFSPSRHPLPTCFVCGPRRDPGDGLRIHPGPLDPDDTDWLGPLAAPWVPGDDLGDEQGLVRPEFLWAALDCPTAYASSSGAGMRSILLGRQSVAIHGRPGTGVRCVVSARATGQDGRKYFAESALHDESGRCLAECRAVWIEVSPDVQRGLAG